MNTKEHYLEQAEIKVKELVAYLYESEADSLREISKLKERLDKKMAELEEYIATIKKQKKDLQQRMDQLKLADDDRWEQAKNDLELQILSIENDRDGFIRKAELIISDLTGKIQELEEKTVHAAAGAKTELNERLKDLKKVEEELKEKLNRIQEDTTDQWEGLKDWFVDKYQYMKDRFSAPKS